MLSTRHDIIAQFKSPVLVSHPSYVNGVRTFSFLHGSGTRIGVDLPKLRIEILGVDYLEYTPGAAEKKEPLILPFQQDCFRLWFQVDGNGILQNLSRNVFGTARPGLLGVMERSQRHTYLHQRGTFEAFNLLFSLLPSPEAKCYWNSGIEGKTVLEGDAKKYFENLIFDLFLQLQAKKNQHGLSTASRILEIIAVLFDKGLIVIEESQFPKNKAKSLIAKAKTYMELHYATMRHQKELERECGVDINYLNSIFRKETGKTLYDFLTSIRMENARHLLETTGIAVGEIASRVGYPNGNSFSRAFKMHGKQSPLAYRNKAIRPRQRSTANPFDGVEA